MMYSTPTYPTYGSSYAPVAPPKATPTFVIMDNTTKTLEKVGAQVVTYTDPVDVKKRVEAMATESPGHEILVLKAVLRSSCPKPTVTTVPL